jgi:RNA polymerase sigma-70 factor (ECF subfamily)
MADFRPLVLQTPICHSLFVIAPNLRLIFFIQILHERCLLGENVNCDSPHWSQRLYETKAAELVLYGRALGLSHAESEDVLQETFAALMQQVQPPAKLEHYGVRTFRNRALNYRRSLWRRLTRELESWRWFERSTDESPAEREAMRCLAELPVEQREVIVLKIWHRRTFEEIGELLDISPNTAAGRYRYGLQKLKIRLEGEEYERERDEPTGESITFLAAAPAFREH